MDHVFWHSRWQQNQIGFHLSAVNPRLAQHYALLPPPDAGPILVPLCGKSVDLAWLAQRGHRVVGVELSELAVRAFFAEQGMAHTIELRGALTCYRSDRITIYQGDLFALEAPELGAVAGYYDRAALVALPPPLRARYAAHLATLLPRGTQGLLVCFEYPQAERAGPPFSVETAEVHALYDDGFAVAPVAHYDILDEEPRFREAGVTALAERVYQLARG